MCVCCVQAMAGQADVCKGCPGRQLCLSQGRHVSGVVGVVEGRGSIYYENRLHVALIGEIIILVI